MTSCLCCSSDSRLSYSRHQPFALVLTVSFIYCNRYRQKSSPRFSTSFVFVLRFKSFLALRGPSGRASRGVLSCLSVRWRGLSGRASGGALAAPVLEVAQSSSIYTAAMHALLCMASLFASTNGLVSFEAAIAIAYFRGIAAKEIPADQGVDGAMLAVGTSAQEARKLLQGSKGYAVVAAVNSPNSVTISGDVDTIQRVHQQAEQQGLFVRRLKVTVAYHSRHMERAADSYLASITPHCSAKSKPTVQQPTTPRFISSVTGTGETADPTLISYWVKNLVQPVQYLQAVETLYSSRGSIDGNGQGPDIM